VSVTDIFGGGACVCVNTGSSPKMGHAQTCPSPPDVVAVMTQFLMTQQPASQPDVYSKSSSKVLGRFPTIKSITGRWLSYRKANSKTVWLYARQKFPGFDRGSGYSSIYNKRTSFCGRSLCLSRIFGGRSLCLSRTRAPPPKWNMPKHAHRMWSPWWRNLLWRNITTRCL
jgi:hypothetical protein